MCGRFALTLPPEAMVQIFGAAPANDLPEVPNWNICPTNAVHAVLSQEGSRRLVSLRWGFVPLWYTSPSDGPLLINARAETIATKPAFRQAARDRRCLIPASGFYEWTKDEDGRRLPWYIHPQEGEFVAFAGIWQDWSSPEGAAMSTCAIVTTAANEALGHIHHRMPVTVAAPDWALWLGEAGHGAAVLMRPGPEDLLAAHRVDPKVNSNRAEGPELIEPFDG
ncbi:SOS response-associated peptidase [Poseidonocella sp. HB161398]|uniref:SOS response-associated peptidase n=1 Tax=Poseidonocella sp. HB161398 TaxID=2320855 RepID=UPI001108E21A|nr:SOS response-associated peptidase [Poseidonocella sp. HB161398]